MEILDACKGLPERSFEPGALLLGEGETADVLYVLLAGSVEILRGETRLTHVDEPGAPLGEISALLDQPHAASVRATAPTRCYVIEDPRRFLVGHADLGLSLSRLLARRLQSVLDLVSRRRTAGDRTLEDPAAFDQLLESLLY